MEKLKKKNKILSIQKSIYKKTKTLSLLKRLSYRSRNVYLGRTGTELSRVDRLVATLSKNGKKKRVEDAILDLKVRIKEYFLPRSSSDFLENILTRLEPMLDVLEVKNFKRKHSNIRYKKAQSFIVKPASTNRRIRLGINFFIKAIRLSQKRLQFTLATAMMNEVIALCHGLKCRSMRLKRDHLKKTFQLYNRFGTPVEVGSKKTTPKQLKKFKKK